MTGSKLRGGVLNIVHQAKETSAYTLITRKHNLALQGYLNLLNTRNLYRCTVLSSAFLITLSICQKSINIRKSVCNIILIHILYADVT